MGESLKAIKEVFELTDRDLRSYSPLTLAYLGDAVYEVIIRCLLTGRGNCSVNKLHQSALAYVSAGSQARLMDRIEPLLTQEEEAVFRRGRTAHSPTMAKHASMADYRRATGFEALVGFLFLEGKEERILELIHAGIIGQPEEDVGSCTGRQEG